MILRELQDFLESNDIPQNANTRLSSIHTAIAAVILTKSRKEALTLCKAQSEFFAIIRDDTAGFSPVGNTIENEFCQETYIDSAMVVYDFISCLMVLDDSELTKRLNITKEMYGGFYEKQNNDK